MMFRVEDTQIELYAHEESNNMAGKVATAKLHTYIAAGETPC